MNDDDSPVTDGEGEVFAPRAPRTLAGARARYWKRPFRLAKPDRVTSADIYGMVNVKTRADELIQIINARGAGESEHLPMPKGILFHGEPGYGKTLNVRRILSLVTARCYDVREFPREDAEFSEWDVHALWKGARAEAKRSGLPVVLVWEEITAHVITNLDIKGKDPITAAIGTEMDGLRGQRAPVFLVATANELEGVDDSLTRPGRMLLAECTLPRASESRRLLADQLRRWKLPAPSEADLADLIDRNILISPATIVDMVERVALRASALTAHAVSEETIADLLAEQMFDVPDDIGEDEDELITAWHEVGHAVVCYLLGVPFTLVNIFDLFDQEGAVHFAHLANETYLDGFLKLVCFAAGKQMERLIYGDEAIPLYGAEADYMGIAKIYVEMVVQAGGPKGNTFDYNALRELLSATTNKRMETIDIGAFLLMQQVAPFAFEMLHTINAALQAEGSSLHAALTPFVHQLVEKRLILGNRACAAFARLLPVESGHFRTAARDRWAAFDGQMAARSGTQWAVTDTARATEERS